MAQLSFRILAIELFERQVRLRLPFRFGSATVTEAPQAFVRARIRLGSGGVEAREATGAAAELMIPKWFDKSPQKSNADNVADLRRALAGAAAGYVSEPGPSTAFGHFATHHGAIIAAGAAAGLNALTAAYGPALIDRALLDALCRALDVSFADAVRGNIAGIDARLTPDLDGFDFGRFLRTLRAAPVIAARHTVGLLDPLDTDDARPVADGLPVTLEQVIAVYGNRYFKLKLGGDQDADLGRLARIASILDRLPEYAVTLDGNEQFASVAAIDDFWRRACATPALRRLIAAALYLEQPLPRAMTLDADVTPMAAALPFLIDESDSILDAFPLARRRGYTGVSSKSCKGFYKSLINAARCAQANAAPGARLFLSGEDLTAQAGLAVQQDLALASLLGLAHVERNGHHYADGFAGQGSGEAEQLAFLRAQPGLYRADRGNVRLAIDDGVIDIRSLDAPGFASRAEPDWSTMTPLQLAAPIASPVAP